jgi:dTMP kinase
VFVSFEGGEGAGKSTQAYILQERLSNAGFRSILVHEPGSTPLGWHLREYLKSQQPLTNEAELLLFEAARVELVINEVKSALKEGITVIADRFEASTVAYQGYGRGLDLDLIERLNSFATQGIYPNLTFFLDIDPAEGLTRVGNLQLMLPLDAGDYSVSTGTDIKEEHRRFEDQPLQFQNSVRAGYQKLAEENPHRWVTLDGSRTVKQISEDVWACVLERLGG